MIRPVVLEFPKDRTARYVELEYFLGSHLLVAPVFDQDELEVYLPQGVWTDWFTGVRVEGGRWVSLEPTLETIPVFIRENAMIPCLQEIPADIDVRYEHLHVILSLGDRISETYYDDGICQKLEAEIEKDTLQVRTDMPVSRLTIYTGVKLTRAVVNGQEAVLSMAASVKDMYSVNI